MALFGSDRAQLEITAAARPWKLAADDPQMETCTLRLRDAGLERHRKKQMLNYQIDQLAVTYGP